MLADKNRIRERKFGLAFILLVLISLIFVFFYYLFAYYKNNRIFNSSKDRDKVGTVILDNNDSEKRVRKQYITNENLPPFIEYLKIEVPPEADLDYDEYQQIGVRIVSTGEITRTDIYNHKNEEKIGEVDQLKVFIKNGDDYLTNNQPFNIALKVYIDRGDGEYVTNIAPNYLMSLAGRLEFERLMAEYEKVSDSGQVSEEVLNEVSDKVTVYKEDILMKSTTDEILEDVFISGREFLVTPFLDMQDGMTKEVTRKSYQDLLVDYYGNDYSTFIREIVEEGKLSSIQPVLLIDIYYLIGTY